MKIKEIKKYEPWTSRNFIKYTKLAITAILPPKNGFYLKHIISNTQTNDGKDDGDIAFIHLDIICEFHPTGSADSYTIADINEQIPLHKIRTQLYKQFRQNLNLGLIKISLVDNHPITQYQPFIDREVKLTLLFRVLE